MVERTTVLGIARRRWYVVLPALVASLLAVLAIETTREHDYYVQGSLLLAAPETGATDRVAAASSLRGILGRADDEIVREDEIDLTVTARDQASFDLSASGTSPSAVEDTLADASRWVEEEFASARRSAENGDEWPDVLINDAENVPVLEEGTYSASSTIWLGATSWRDNPYSGPNLLRLISIAFSSDRGTAELEQLLGPGVLPYISYDPRDDAPVLTISVLADSPDAAQAAYADVEEFVRAELAERQDRSDIPENRRYGLDVLARPVEPVRAEAVPGLLSWAVILGGLTVGVVVAALLDWRKRQYWTDEPLRSSTDGLGLPASTRQLSEPPERSLRG